MRVALHAAAGLWAHFAAQMSCGPLIFVCVFLLPRVTYLELVLTGRQAWQLKRYLPLLIIFGP